MHYIGTSALVAFYVPEGVSGKVQRFYSSLDTAAISALTEVEVYSAVSRRVRMKELARDDARSVVSRFKAHVEGRLYQMIPLTEREFALARTWLGAFETSLRALDALHLAAAFANDLVLVTVDKALVRSGRYFGVECELLSY